MNPPLIPTQNFHTTHLASPNLSKHKLRSRPSRLIAIRQMNRQHDQTPSADQIALLAVNQQPVRREVRNFAIILLVLGPPEQDHTLDLLPDNRAAVADGCADEGRALAIIRYAG